MEAVHFITQNLSLKVVLLIVILFQSQSASFMYPQSVKWLRTKALASVNAKWEYKSDFQSMSQLSCIEHRKDFFSVNVERIS